MIRTNVLLAKQKQRHLHIFSTVCHRNLTKNRRSIGILTCIFRILDMLLSFREIPQLLGIYHAPSGGAKILPKNFVKKFRQKP